MKSTEIIPTCQGMSTELLKAYVYNEPIAVAGAATSGLPSPSAIVSGMGLGKVSFYPHPLPCSRRE